MSARRRKNIKKGGRGKGMAAKVVGSIMLICLVLGVTFILAILEYREVNPAGSLNEDFYRAVMPVFIALGAVLILLLMLMSFLLSYYVRPTSKMNKALLDYLSFGKHYKLDIDADDQLASINNSICELVAENTLLKDRIKALKARLQSESPDSQDKTEVQDSHAQNDVQ